MGLCRTGGNGGTVLFIGEMNCRSESDQIRYWFGLFVQFFFLLQGRGEGGLTGLTG